LYVKKIAIKKRLYLIGKKLKDKIVKKKTIWKTMYNKTNSNKKNKKQIWQIKKSIGDEIEKKS